MFLCCIIRRFGQRLKGPTTRLPQRWPRPRPRRIHRPPSIRNWTAGPSTSATEMAPSLLTSSGQTISSSSASMMPLQLLSMPMAVPGAPGYMVLLASLQSPSRSTVPAGVTPRRSIGQRIDHIRLHLRRNRLGFRSCKSRRPMSPRRRSCMLQDWCSRRRLVVRCKRRTASR